MNMRTPRDVMKTDYKSLQEANEVLTSQQKKMKKLSSDSEKSSSADNSVSSTADSDIKDQANTTKLKELKTAIKKLRLIEKRHKKVVVLWQFKMPIAVLINSIIVIAVVRLNHLNIARFDGLYIFMVGFILMLTFPLMRMIGGFTAKRAYQLASDFDRAFERFQTIRKT